MGGVIQGVSGFRVYIWSGVWRVRPPPPPPPMVWSGRGGGGGGSTLGKTRVL